MIARVGSSDTQYWIIHVSKLLNDDKKDLKNVFGETPLRLNSYTFSISTTIGMH